MKKQQVCALLCVAAMSATSVTPVMAADAALPEETVAVQSETEAAGEAVQEEAPEASEEAGETEAVQKEAPEASEASEEAGEAEAAGEVQEEEQQTAEVLKDAGTTIQNGWQFIGDYWYYFKDGSVLKDTFETINGSKYYFDDEGIMQTGVFLANYQEDNQWVSKKLFANASGAIITTPGWQSQGGTWYYVKVNGEAAASELVEINGSSYYFNSEGAMQIGLISTYENNEWHSYIANASGAIVKGGWIKEGLDWYYTDADGIVCTNKWIGNCYVTINGTMAVGDEKIDGKTYLFDENGYKQMVIGEQSGWTLADGTWYYYTAKGKPYNGWLNHTYYIENGRMMTDATVPSEHNNSAHDYYSYVGADGAVASGWVETSYGWRYAEKNAATGDLVLVEDDWRKIGNTWYYFDEMDMVLDTIMKVDGKLSQFAASGAWQGFVSGAGWKKTASGDWYYVNDDGTLNTESKKEIGGLTYYFYDGDGMMRKNEPFRDEATGKYFWINANGNRDTKDGWKLAKYGSWYYVENGSLVGEGEKVVSGAVYHFSVNGSMVTGMRYENGKYYIYGANGGKTEATSGWYSGTEYGKTLWYYFINGQPYTGFVGNYYIEYGRMLTDLIYSESGGYMFDENGHLFTGGWIYRWGAWYYAGKTGRIYTGEWNIGGRRYIFNSYGEWVK